MIAGVDLLVVGGLSIDRFADGSRRAGGSVLHATRAVHADGLGVASIVLAGPEPEAAVALAELHAAGPCRLHDAQRSIRFGIDERGARRRLVFEGGAGPLAVTSAEVAGFAAHAVLLAPVAGELDPPAVTAAGAPVRVAALQGWLRLLRVGRAVRPRPLAQLGEGLVAALGSLDALIASVQDLGPGSADPLAALAALRRTFGDRPMLFVTAGETGAWLDLRGAARLHVVPPRVIRAVSSVGAGDAFAGLLTAALGRGVEPEIATREAAAGVVELLAERAG